MNIKEGLDNQIHEFFKLEWFKFFLLLPQIFLEVLNGFKGIVNDYIEIARKSLKSYLCYFCIHIPFNSNVSLNALLELDEYRLENEHIVRTLSSRIIERWKSMDESQRLFEQMVDEGLLYFTVL